MVRFALLFLFFFASGAPAYAAPLLLHVDFIAPPQEVFVGQEAGFRLRLWDRIGVSDIRPVPSDWENVDVFLDPGIPSKTEIRDGVPYEVRDIHFSFVVKTAGKMPFMPFCISAAAPSLITGRQLPPDVTFISRLGRLQICSPAFSVTAVSLPRHRPPLFPARKVSLYTGVVPKSGTVSAGTPVKRSVVLSASGTLPAYLPDFNVPPIENARIYDGKVERTLDAAENRLMAALRQTSVFIPEQPGKLVLPEMKVFWYNVDTRMIEEAVVPAYSIDVVSAAGESKIQTVQVQEKPRKLTLFDRIENAAALIGRISFKVIVPGAVFIFLGFLYGLPVLKKYLERRRLEQRVENACRAGNPEEMEKALISWARAVFSPKTVLSLSDIRAVFEEKNTGFAQALDELEQRLYGMERFAKHLPDFKEKIGGELLGEKIGRTFRSAASIKKRPPKKDRDFPGLYPDE